jgi:phenylpropionate dioxygenase-like ring-hydroxylating dioxygenase large terminal subunit
MTKQAQSLRQQPPASGTPNARAFSADPLSSYTLPPQYYYDPRLYEQEREQIFFRNWQYVGHAAELREPGDYIVGSILDQKILVTRTDTGDL